MRTYEEIIAEAKALDAEQGTTPIQDETIKHLKDTTKWLIEWITIIIGVLFMSFIVYGVLFNPNLEVNGGHCYNGWSYNHTTKECQKP